MSITISKASLQVVSKESPGLKVSKTSLQTASSVQAIVASGRRRQVLLGSI